MKYLKLILLSALLLVPSLAGAASVGTSAAGSPGARFYSQTFTSSGSFVVPNGVDTIIVTGCSAGGGGAGGHTADPGGGGGGGAGSFCISKMPLAVTQGSTLTITIGTAGLGGNAGAVGGTTNLVTTIAGLPSPMGTYTIITGSAAGQPTAGTVTNGGAGGSIGSYGGQGSSSTGAGNASTLVTPRFAGGDYTNSTGGGGGGGATGPGAGGGSLSVSGYSLTTISGGAANGTKGGGGAGGSSPFGVGGVGGSNAAGTACSVGYGGGGGGGAPTFAGGNGCPGYLKIDWWN